MASETALNIFKKPNQPNRKKHSPSDSNESQRSPSPTSCNNVCVELSLEAERLSRSGDIQMAIQCLEKAVHTGTDDIAMLSRIYCQLGNYYFILQNYPLALKYHRLDLILARKMNDVMGEAKSFCNLGNTLKQLQKFDEAVFCCKRYLDIAIQLQDKDCECRALFYLANVYHNKGKKAAIDWFKQTASSNSLVVSSLEIKYGETDQLPQHVQQTLQMAVDFYEQNLTLVMEHDDRAAEGRVCGNLGNVYYLLSDFKNAINYHQKRLFIAKEFGDRAAQRRAHSNLGNAYLFLADFNEALKQYTKALQLALHLHDSSLEAQSYFNLGTTFTLQRDFPQAIKYHKLHLNIAEQLQDYVGEAKACWCLYQIYLELKDWTEALIYCQRNLNLCQLIDDESGKLTAQMHLIELKRQLDGGGGGGCCGNSASDIGRGYCSGFGLQSKDSFIEPTTKATFCLTKKPTKDSEINNELENANESEGDELFNLLNKIQSRRMNEQRCSINADENPDASEFIISPAQESFFDFLIDVQGSRMNDQRASLSLENTFPGLLVSPRVFDQLCEDAILDGGEALSAHTAGLRRNVVVNSTSVNNAAVNANDPDAFLDMLMRLQATRINDQRSTLPTSSSFLAASRDGSNESPVSSSPPPPQPPSSSQLLATTNRLPVSSNPPSVTGSSTMPDEDFFAHIMRVQSSRLDEQRCNLPDMPAASTTATLSSTNNNNNSRSIHLNGGGDGGAVVVNGGGPSGSSVSASTSLPSMFNSKNRIKSNSNSRKGSRKAIKSKPAAP